jgi:predicted dehydrogenase
VNEAESAARGTDEGFELTRPFSPRKELAWTAVIPSEHAAALADRRAAVVLFENERRLGPSNAMEADICSTGRGLYAVWTNEVCFSTSDGSDPNMNQRRYRLVLPRADIGGQRPSVDLPWTRPDRPLGCAVIGLGARGFSFAREMSLLPGVELRWLVDASHDRLLFSRDRLALPDTPLTSDVGRALRDPAVDAVFIAVPDYLHRPFAVAAFEAGKHVFLEKPVATTSADGWSIMQAWRRSGRVLQLGYVLRDTPFYSEVRRIVREGRLGHIHSVILTDHLGIAHGASYMRRWHRDSSKSGGLMVHKGCHDLDLACWLFDTQPSLVSSFGGLSTFGRSAPARFCSQCPEEAICLYRDEGAYEDRMPQQRADPARFGLDLCVFAEDKDIVDNQVVNFELRNGARGTFTLAVNNPRGSQRRISIFGEAGKLEGDFNQNHLELSTDPGVPSGWSVENADEAGHGGGDRRILRSFLDACLGRREPEVRTEADAMRGLVFAQAAEQSREFGTIVRVSDDLMALSSMAGSQDQ